MNRKKIIFNADDYGHTKGINLGIIDSHQNGPVTSTTIMANGAAFDHAVILAKENPGLKIGVHLTLTTGKSLGGVYETITDEEGNFLTLAKITKRANEGTLNINEIVAEYTAQIQKVLDVGLVPEHFDSHHHTHHLPGIFDAFLNVAKAFGIKKVRMFDKKILEAKDTDISTTDGFADGFYGDGVTIENLKKIITDFEGESLEIMLHPAFVDSRLYKTSSYSIQRTFELEVLTSKELREFLNNNTNYQLCSFSTL